jgi:hypothetical protein
MASSARVMQAVPVWDRVVRADAALGLAPRTLLHAGPPFLAGEPLPLPVRHAAIAAILLEGLATTPDQASASIDEGRVVLRPAQEHGVVTPLAGVVSASQWLQRVTDQVHGGCWYAPLNEGGGPAAQRLGRLDPAVVARLHRVHHELGPLFGRVCAEPVPLLPLARAGLDQGDEMHGQVGVATVQLAQLAAARLGESDPVVRHMVDATQFCLNLWMAACATMLGAGGEIPGSTLVVGAGGNGHRFGIRLGASPQAWVAGPAGVPVGPTFPGGEGCVRLPAIGDSAVIDALGLGAMALDACPNLMQSLGSVAAQAAGQATALLVDHHGVLGRAAGLDAARVAAWGRPPLVCLAALDASGEAGLVGRGLAAHPLECYAHL